MYLDGMQVFFDISFYRVDRVLQQNHIFDIFADPYFRMYDEELGIEQGNQVVLQVCRLVKSAFDAWLSFFLTVSFR